MISDRKTTMTSDRDILKVKAIIACLIYSKIIISICNNKNEKNYYDIICIYYIQGDSPSMLIFFFSSIMQLFNIWFLEFLNIL